jgi:hypothetical protein
MSEYVVVFEQAEDVDQGAAGRGGELGEGEGVGPAISSPAENCSWPSALCR